MGITWKPLKNFFLGPALLGTGQAQTVMQGEDSMDYKSGCLTLRLANESRGLNPQSQLRAPDMLSLQSL